MKFDTDRCVQCGQLRLANVVSENLDNRGRSDPSDPFWFCSDSCFQKALTPFWGDCIWQTPFTCYEVPPEVFAELIRLYPTNTTDQLKTFYDTHVKEVACL